MRKISSRSTFFYKRIFPIIWFGFLALALCSVVGNGIQQRNFVDVFPIIVVPFFLATIGYLVMKWLIFDLVDEVWDAGTELIIRNGGSEEIIELADILNVSYSGHSNPQRVTLMLREPCAFGDQIAFMPPFRVFPFSMPPLVIDLIRRVDAARRQSEQ
jgi:hypothetical protein